MRFILNHAIKMSCEARAHRFFTPLAVLVFAVILCSIPTANTRSVAAPLPNGPIIHEETQTGGSSSSTTVATSTNLTGVNGHLYLAAISTQPRKSVVSVTGLGLTWTLVKDQCSGVNTTGIEVWKAQGTPSGNGMVTATLASASTATVITVSRYSGVDAVNPIGNVISGNTNGANASAVCTGGVASSSYSFNLTTTVNDAMVYSAVAIKSRTHTPGAGYTERAEFKQVGGGLTSGIAVEDMTVATTAGVPVNGSLSGTADWAEVGLEIKPHTDEPPQNMIVHEETQTGGSSSSTTVATSTNLTGVNGHLYLAAISTQPRKTVVSVTGLGLTWTLVKNQCSGVNTTGIEVWKAQGTPSGNGVVTATLASASTATVITVSRYSGVDAVNPIGNVISGNTNGANASAVCTGGVASGSYLFNLTTTVNDAMVYSAVAIKSRTHNPGDGYTERAEIKQVGGSLTSTIAVEDKMFATAGTFTVDGSLNGTADWAEVAVEIKPQTDGPIQYTLTVNTVGSGSVALNPTGGTYNAGTEVTLTATPASGFQFSGWSGDLSGSTNPETITMDGNKNVTATFSELPVIVHEETQTGGSSSSTTVATSANITGVNGHLYLAAISTQPRKTVVSVTGLGLTWTLVKNQCSGVNTTGVEVWKAQGTPSGNGVVTATLASASTATVITVSRYSGVAAVSPIGNVISGNTNGANASAVCTGGVASSSYSFNLVTTVNDAMVYSAVAMKSRTHTPDAGYTERAEIKQVGGSLTSSIAVEDMTVATTASVPVNGSLNGTADWAEVAVEIRPQTAEPIQYTLTVNTVGSGSVALNPTGGTYNAGTEVTLTATPGSGFQFSGWSGDLSGSTNPETITMDGNKNVTATFTEISVSAIVHQESQTGGTSGATTVATLASPTGVNGHLYLAAISSRPQAEVTAVSGLGLSWQRLKAQCSGRSQTGIEVWVAQGAPSGNGTVTATLAATTTTAAIAVSRYSGVDAVNPIGNVIFGNTNGVAGSCSNGLDNNFYSFNLLTTENGSVVYGAVAVRSRTHTPGAGYMERAESNQGGTNTFASTVAVEDKSVASPSTVAVAGTMSGNVDWALVALEIRPQGSGTPQFALTTYTLGAGDVSLNPDGGLYDDGTEVTLTANPAAGFQFSGWSGDLTGSANPALITMDASKHVTATFTPITLAEAITHEEIQTGGAADSNLVKTSASLIGVSGQLYLAAISTRSKVAVSAVSGLGLSWTLVKAQCSGQNLTGVEVWMAQGTPSLNGPVMAKLSGSPDNSVIAVSRYSGVHQVDPIGNMTSGNTVGVAAACSLGVNSNVYSFPITTTVSGAVVYGAATMRMRTHTPGAGYTERADLRQGITGGNMASIAVEDTTVASASTLPVNGTFSGTVDWALVALEITPLPEQFTLTVNTVGSGSVTLNPPGGTYNAGTVVTLTATPAQGFLFSGWSGNLSGSANPATITMNANKTVTATFAVNTGVTHQETKTGGSTGSTTVATSASLTAVSGQLYLAAISTKPIVPVTAVTGLGLSWTLVKSQCSGLSNTGVDIWMAQGTPSGDGAVTATLAITPSNAVIAVSRYSGVAAVNPVGNIVSGNSNGVNGACASGVENNLYSFSLTTTVNGAMAYGAAAMRSRSHTPGAGYAERAEFKQGSGGGIASIAVQDKNVVSAATVTVDGSFSGNVDWAVVGLEIKPQALSKRGEIAGNDELAAPPLVYQLEQNYPNPFNPSTMIKFALPAAGKVIVKIYSETGQLVRTLVDGEMAAGRHGIHWNGKNQAGRSIASGVYLYQIVARGQNGEITFSQTKRMTLLK